MAKKNFDNDSNSLSQEALSELNSMFTPSNFEADSLFDFSEPDEVIVEEKEIDVTKEVVKEEVEVKEVIQEHTSNDIKLEDDTSNEDNEGLFPYVAALKEAGVLPDVNLDDFKGLASEDAVALLMQKNEDAVLNKANELIQAHISNMPPKLRKAYEHYAEGVDLDTAVDAVNKIDYYKNITDEQLEDDQDLARKIIKEAYIADGYSDADAEEFAEDPINPTKTAKKLLNRLVVKEESKIETSKRERELAEENARQSQQKFVSDLKDFVDKSPDYIPGLPIENGLRKKVWERITTTVESKNGNNFNAFGKWMNDKPKESQTVIAYLMEITKDFTDFSKISQTASKQAIKTLENTLKKQDSNLGKGRSANVYQEDNDPSGLTSFIRNMK